MEKRVRRWKNTPRRTDNLLPLIKGSFDWPVILRMGPKVLMELSDTDAQFLNESYINSANEEEVDTCELFYFMINGILGIIICSVGLIGNILSFWIIKQMNKKSATFFVFRCLAISDALYLFFCAVLIVVPEIILYSQALQYFYSEFQYAYIIMFPFSSMALTVTTWMTCLLAVHR